MRQDAIVDDCIRRKPIQELRPKRIVWLVTLPCCCYASNDQLAALPLGIVRQAFRIIGWITEEHGTSPKQPLVPRIGHREHGYCQLFVRKGILAHFALWGPFRLQKMETATCDRLIQQVPLRHEPMPTRSTPQQREVRGHTKLGRKSHH